MITKGFWAKLKKPIMALAPMANVTDAAFRAIIAKYGKPASPGASQGGPDVMWTEFVSADGLCSAGRKRLLLDLKFSQAEHPIVAQFFGANPENFYQYAGLAQELRFDGIDINMGCPDRSVEKQGAGAALIKNPKLAMEIIAATKRGAGRLPVSIKTRISYDRDRLQDWLKYLLSAEPAAIILHARTRQEMSKVPAHWDKVAEAVEIRNTEKAETLILGNGDVASLEEAELKAKETGADGIMIGRGIFGNPWFFNREKDGAAVSLSEKLGVMLEHTRLFAKMFKGLKSLEIMKKHYKAYVTGFAGARELRAELMNTKNVEEMEEIVSSFLAHKSP